MPITLLPEPQVSFNPFRKLTGSSYPNLLGAAKGPELLASDAV